MRSSLLEVIGTDYMRTAAAKGLAFRTILFKHGLKNALIPVVTIVALSLPGIVGRRDRHRRRSSRGPGWAGSSSTRCSQIDFALLMGYLLLVAFLVVFSNLLADVVYAWLDPRVKYD